MDTCDKTKRHYKQKVTQRKYAIKIYDPRENVAYNITRPKVTKGPDTFFHQRRHHKNTKETTYLSEQLLWEVTSNP